MSTKGQILRVDPLKSLAEVKRVKAVLANHPRNLAIFTLGVNTALRASDIVKLNREDVRYLKAGDVLPLRMKKTKKIIDITLNQEVIDAIRPLLIEGNGPLFASENDPSRYLTESHLCRLVQDWCHMAHLKGRYGSHSMRKSWAHLQLKLFHAKEEHISVALGHSTVRQTRLYLCIQDEEVTNLFMNCI